jgi:hypothetical protein
MPELTDEDLKKLEDDNSRRERTAANNKLTGRAKYRLKRERSRNRKRAKVRRGEARS